MSDVVENTDGIKRSEAEEDETNSRSEVYEEESSSSTPNSPKVTEAQPEGGCFSTIREQANLEDLSN